MCVHEHGLFRLSFPECDLKRPFVVAFDGDDASGGEPSQRSILGMTVNTKLSKESIRDGHSPAATDHAQSKDV
jgi:hypothetical protein